MNQSHRLPLGLQSGVFWALALVVWSNAAAIGQSCSGPVNLPLPPAEFSMAWGVSGDGATIAGSYKTAAMEYEQACVWTQSGGFQNLHFGGDVSRAVAVSHDGSYIAGYFWEIEDQLVRIYPVRATVSGVVNQLPTLGGFQAVALAMSGDGRVIVGSSETYQDSDGATRQAFRWTEETGTVGFGPVSWSGVWPEATSFDGAVVVGGWYPSGDARAFRWTESEGMTDLGSFGGESTWAYAVSCDGSVVTGLSQLPNGQARAFLWTQATGIQPLQGVPVNSIPKILSKNGEVVFGDSPSGAFRWSAQAGFELIGGIGTSIEDGSSNGGILVGRDTNSDYRASKWSCEPVADAGCQNEDTDGDGIPDDWENNGIPYTDGNGVVQRIPLPGADPQRKDLFVEIDLMSGQTLDLLVISKLEIAFDQAPVPNPNGRRDGIALHLVIDDQDLPFIGQWQVFGDDDAWPADFDNFRLNSFGSIDERFHPDAEAMLEAKAKVYRYGVIASEHTPMMRNGSPYWVSGVAEGIPSDNFVIFLDYVRVTSGANSRAVNEAAVIMHELGHCLGLSHGGCDNENQGQTNQPSIMNYVYAAPFNWNATTWQMDYLRVGPESLGPLVESNLNETTGIGSPGGVYSHVFMPFGVDYCGIPPCLHVRRHDYVRLNGSPVDFGSLTPDHIRNQDGIFSVSVVQDLNYLADDAGAGEIALPTRESPGQTFSVCNEWERVAQNLKPVAARGTRGKIGPRPIEPSVADIQWIDENLPPAPTICSPDLTGDGVLDLADIVQFITAFINLDPIADYAEPSGVFDLADLVAFVTAFNAGCP